ncbi:MAG: serine protease [Planctomycetes bacterium]|nr:serine protease [Planctomycetota bacterium]
MKTTPRRAWVGALSAVALLFALALPARAQEYISQDVAQRVAAATVMVHIEYDGPEAGHTSWGSGFVVGNGLIMTNAHVVKDQTPKRIYVHNQYLPVTPARVLAARYDPDGRGTAGSSYYDGALLAYTPPAGLQLPVLPFTTPYPQQGVFAFGYPGQDRPAQFGSETSASGAALNPPLSITGGMVNSVLRSKPSLVKHDALCYFGNSGGPLVTARGEVVGMQTWSAEPDHRNVVDSFAIGSHGLADFMMQSGYQPYFAR